tara:strand:- start:776 stop:1024 length:249 start_codon:yes stop_codon:yes gene_type:complete
MPDVICYNMDCKFCKDQNTTRGTCTRSNVTITRDGCMDRERNIAKVHNFKKKFCGNCEKEICGKPCQALIEHIDKNFSDQYD